MAEICSKFFADTNKNECCSPVLSHDSHEARLATVYCVVFVKIEARIGFVRIINSRTAIAGAIIGLLLVFFYFVVMIFVTTI